MRVAILGANSQIAKDLILSFSKDSKDELFLYSRRPGELSGQLELIGLANRYCVDEYENFGDVTFDAILNFVGAGNPAKISAMGASFFEVTAHYDELALGYLRAHPECRYIFLSSGAAYGSKFEEPVDENSKAEVAINAMLPQDWYAVAKLYAECRHRAMKSLSIVDVRIFNYFSHTQDVEARFLITDILRSIRNNSVLITSSESITRDFIHPSDFYQLIRKILLGPHINEVLDCYSLAPVDKKTLLEAMRVRFGLHYLVAQTSPGVNATGTKPHYYSRSRRAAEFGYEPKMSSLEGVLIEADKLLEMSG
jgi:nucleoside-diphosphate-sugar epimerase